MDANDHPREHPPEPGRDAAAGAEVDLVTRFRLPPFWKAHPDLWFIQVESAFQGHRITSGVSKYHHVVAALDPDTVCEVADVLQDPPERGMYEKLKAAILSRLTDSVDRRLHTLLTDLELGDQKPTQLLRRMRLLAGGKVPDAVLRVKWLDMLPPSARRVLRDLRAGDLDELAESADELVDRGPSIAAVSRASRERSPSPRELRSSITDELAAMRTALAQLVTLTRENLAATSAPAAQLGPRPRSRSRAPTPPIGSRPAERPSTCWYHRVHGSEAQRCRPPCDYRTSGN